jgi:L-threonylcarbamoyladenylate synthase
MRITKDPKLAAQSIREGKLVLFPTETVYGLGASARNHQACLNIYQVKNRPMDNPFIVHVSDPDEFSALAEVPELYWPMIRHFSPGPIAYIFRKKDNDIFSTGLSTIGLRVPDHPVCQEFLALAGPVSAPSANKSGKPSITQKKYLWEEFQGSVDILLEGEDPKIGIESTVLDLTDTDPILLRPGKISFEALQKFFPNLKRMDTSTDSPRSPGLKYKHYSPDCQLFWYDSQSTIPEGAGFLGFQKISSDFSVFLTNNLDYMREMYGFFIECDRRKLKIAYCEPPLDDEYTESLQNRLSKAMGNTSY